MTLGGREFSTCIRNFFFKLNIKKTPRLAESSGAFFIYPFLYIYTLLPPRSDMPRFTV